MFFVLTFFETKNKFTELGFRKKLCIDKKRVQFGFGKSLPQNFHSVDTFILHNSERNIFCFVEILIQTFFLSSDLEKL